MDYVYVTLEFIHRLWTEPYTISATRQDWSAMQWYIRNGSYGLVEIKLGGEKLINEGAKTLLELRDRIDTTKMKSPSFMMVLTGVGDYAYRRTDGVLVVPVGCLKD